MAHVTGPSPACAVQLPLYAQHPASRQPQLSLGLLEPVLQLLGIVPPCLQLLYFGGQVKGCCAEDRARAAQLVCHVAQLGGGGRQRGPSPDELFCEKVKGNRKPLDEAAKRRVFLACASNIWGKSTLGQRHRGRTKYHAAPQPRDLPCRREICARTSCRVNRRCTNAPPRAAAPAKRINPRSPPLPPTGVSSC